jgi:hypothetical protein
LLPSGVEDFYVCLRGRAVRIFTFQQPPDHGVAPHIEETYLAAQCTFVREAKLAGNGSGGRIPGVTMNFDAMDMNISNAT